MIIMTLLLMTILFLTFFVYFSGINPQEVSIYFYQDHHVSVSVAIAVVACILVGLIMGYGAHLFVTATHMFKHWRKDRGHKRSKEIEATFREGVARLLSGDVKKAHVLLQKALDKDPSRIDIHLALANVYQQESNVPEAIQLLLKAREMDRASLEVLFKLASCYEESSMEKEAVATYLEILEKEATNRKALRGLRDLYMVSGNWAEALVLQKKILKVGVSANRQDKEKQNLVSIRYEVARQSVDAGEADQAKSELKDIIKHNPSFVPARVTLGDAIKATGKADDPIKIWQEGFRATGRSIFLARLEEHFLSIEDPARLLGLYKAMTTERPDDMLLRMFYGRLCLRLEMVEEACEQLYVVESSGTDSPQLHLLLAEAHRRRDRTEESIAQYQKALGVDPQLKLGYVCEECGTTNLEWKSRCKKCGTWGSFALSGRQQIKNITSPEMRAIPHGQR